jgi:hypothetical protein
VPGVGLVTAMTFRLELPEPERFDDAGQVLVGDEAGRIGADDGSRDEVSHNRGKPEAERHIAADGGRGQSAGQRQYQVEFMHGPRHNWFGTLSLPPVGSPGTESSAGETSVLHLSQKMQFYIALVT